MKNRKGLRILLFLVYISIIIILIFISKAHFTEATDKKESKAGEFFLIDSYNINLNVSKDNKVDVRESITVDWKKPRHGIDRKIPTWLKYTSDDGKTYSRKAKIEVYQTPELLNVTKGKRYNLRLGDETKYTNYGLHTYDVHYSYDFGKDIYNGFDELIFHAYGEHWETEINNPTLTVNMPTDIQNYKIRFYADKYRKEEITQYIDYRVLGNTVTASLKNGYKLEGALTFDIVLPEGYFETTENIYNNISAYLCVGAIILSIVLFSLWRIYGKDKKKIKDKEQYYPPEGLDSASIAYIYNNCEVSYDIIIALIVELAGKGYIRIDKNEKVEIDKKGKEKKSEEIIIYNLCMENGKSPRISEGVTIPSNIQYKSKTELKPLTKNEEVVYNKLFEDNDVSILKENKTLYEVLTKIDKNLKEDIKYKVLEKKSDTIQKVSVALFAISILLVIIAYYIIADIEPKYQFLYLLSFIISTLGIFPTIYMGRRTQYGDELVAKINGFRKYLETAKKEQLEAMVNQNPKYFYDILPYTYVLGISKQWINSFEKQLHVEDANMGTFDYYCYDDYIFFRNSYYTTYGGSSSGGCSSCGGGCSSCGGGSSW